MWNFFKNACSFHCKSLTKNIASRAWVALCTSAAPLARGKKKASKWDVRMSYPLKLSSLANKRQKLAPCSHNNSERGQTLESDANTGSSNSSSKRERVFALVFGSQAELFASPSFRWTMLPPGWWLTRRWSAPIPTERPSAPCPMVTITVFYIQ